MLVASQPMTLYELLSLVISIAGFMTVIITLALLVRQTPEMTVQSQYVVSSLEKTVYETAAGRGFAVDEIFIDDPKLRPYFYSGKEINEDDPYYHKVMAAADFILDFMDYIVLQPQDFSRVFSARSWEPWMRDAFANSPALFRRLDSVKNRWHSKALVDIMQNTEHDGKSVAAMASNPDDAFGNP
jgi:hypothetical protein